jgi:hypothetical protein
VLDESNLSVSGIKLLSCGVEPPHKFNFGRIAVLLHSPMERLVWLYTVWLYNTHMHIYMHIICHTCILILGDTWLYGRYLYKSIAYFEFFANSSQAIYTGYILYTFYIYAIYFENIQLAATLLVRLA